MAESTSISFNIRALHALAPDRIYRVELRNGALYFLRIGGQFDVDRGSRTPGVPGGLAAVMILAAGEALFRKHKREELIARDPAMDVEELLAIHPHNFKLTPADIKSATLLPKKWFLSLFRPHFGRLILEPADGKTQEYHFENLADLRNAFEHLPSLLGDRLIEKINWDDRKGCFVASG